MGFRAASTYTAANPAGAALYYPLSVSEVTLCNPSRQELGIVVVPVMVRGVAGLQINAIGNGVVSFHNHQKVPSFLIREGDCIIGVNGITAGIPEMVNALSNNSDLNLSIYREHNSACEPGAHIDPGKAVNAAVSQQVQAEGPKASLGWTERQARSLYNSDCSTEALEPIPEEREDDEESDLED